MKLVDNSTKMITTIGKVFEHPQGIPSGQGYVTHFPFMNSIQKQRKVFVCCNVELELRVGKFKYGEKIIMHTLIENNTFLRFNKYKTRQEDSIRWFEYINSIITLQRTTREKVTDTLFQVILRKKTWQNYRKNLKLTKDLMNFVSPYLTSTTRQLET